MTIARTLVVVALSLLLGGLVAGCGHEFGPGESSSARNGPQQNLTADAARSKLELQVQDACYAGDPGQAWPRCGRWVEETASSARTAADALPNDPAIGADSRAVAAGHDAFLGRGCGTSAAASADQASAGPCVAALLQARQGVRALATALRVPGA